MKKYSLEIAYLCGVTLFIGVLIGLYIGLHAYEKQAIERGFAEYNSVTGEWQWKEGIVSATNITVFNNTFGGGE